MCLIEMLSTKVDCLSVSVCFADLKWWKAIDLTGIDFFFLDIILSQDDEVNSISI
jgi:hypothetical protein